MLPRCFATDGANTAPNTRSENVPICGGLVSGRVRSSLSSYGRCPLSQGGLMFSSCRPDETRHIQGGIAVDKGLVFSCSERQHPDQGKGCSLDKDSNTLGRTSL